VSAGPAKRLAAYWDWTAGAKVPDARIVVCARGVLSDDARARMWAEYAKGTAFVADVGGGLPYALELYPALHVTRQADLARLPGLLAVKAERRALVVTPEEAINVEEDAPGWIGCASCLWVGQSQLRLCGNWGRPSLRWTT
jgi:hypothetical protein